AVRSGIAKDPAFLIIPLSIFPISADREANSACLAGEMYPQSLPKSSDESVSPFSPSQSVNLLMKCASYRRFAHASLRFKQIARDDRRIWLVSANLSSRGKHFDNSKISIAST